MWFGKTEKQVDNKKEYLFIYRNTKSFNGGVQLQAIYPIEDKEEALTYLSQPYTEYLEMRSVMWNGKGDIPNYSNTTLVECGAEIKDRREYIRLKAKYEAGETK